MIISLILTIVVAIVAVLFSLQNTQVVHVTFFGYSYQGAIGVFLLVALAVGVMLGVLLMVPSLLRRDFALGRHRRRMEELEDAYYQKMDGGDGTK
jgi:uncharacterized integral membrane protein